VREVQASEAKTRLTPGVARDDVRVRRALDGILAVRKKTKPMTSAEILAARDEGRK